MKKGTRRAEALYPDVARRLSVPISDADFERARQTVLLSDVQSAGIGTLAEKSLHKIIKHYIEPDESCHEVPHLGAVADILRDGEVYEIQTGSYSKLKHKLGRMMSHGRVTVVCPLSYNKRVRWLDPGSGEISEPKMSPKHENIYNALYMLFGIREHIKNENLSILVLFLESEEYRALDGWDKSKKRGSQRIERIPTGILGALRITAASDYAAFIPDDLGDEFVASEFAAAIGGSTRFTYYILKLLVATGALSEGEKRGRAAVYIRNNIQ